MNKTVNINLGGIFFHIDEEAYQKLKTYLDAVRNSLNDDEQGKNEIINDIEIRISELLSEKVKDVRQVVNSNDVDAIIEVMGKPEDYSVEESLFDDDTKINKNRKRLFRDPDDKFLGGVCSGIAHYLGIDPIWVRLFWLFLVVTYGSGVLIYFLLWILLPVANTTSQKLEMEGEDVTISNIEKKVKEEFKDVSNRFKDGVHDFSNELKKGKYESKLKTGLQEIILVIGQLFQILFKNIGKIIGVFLILFSGLVLLSIFISLFSIGSIEFLGIDSNIVQYPPFFYDASIPKAILGIALSLSIGIPFFFLFSLGLKIISSTAKSLSTTSKLTLFGLWLISILLLVFSAIETNLRYANNATVTIEKISNSVKKDTIFIGLKNREDLDFRPNISKIVLDHNVEKFLDSNVQIKIKPSDSDSIKVIIHKKASGISIRKAQVIAKDIEYAYTLDDGMILLNSYFFTKLANKLRNSKVNITLYIPINKIIVLDKNLKYFIRQSSFSNKNFNFDSNKKYYFKMTVNGLQCINCKEILVNTNQKTTIQTESKKNVIEKDTIKLEDSINTNKKTKNKHVKIDENGVQVD